MGVYFPVDLSHVIVFSAFSVSTASEYFTVAVSAGHSTDWVKDPADSPDPAVAVIVPAAENIG